MLIFSLMLAPYCLMTSGYCLMTSGRLGACLLVFLALLRHPRRRRHPRRPGRPQPGTGPGPAPEVKTICGNVILDNYGTHKLRDSRVARSRRILA